MALAFVSDSTTFTTLTADGSVTYTASGANNRTFVFVAYKDQSVTLNMAADGWTQVAEFSNGSVATGNGTGSVRIACWLKDNVSSNPTLDFGAGTLVALASATTFSKGSGDTWDAPFAVTASHSWTTSSTTTSASSTAAVPSGGVVVNCVGVADDSATFTRGTNGVDVASGITWNGNYVEINTHGSTTTGNDLAADSGYRLVTTGATVTLRATGTLSAAESGSIMWVVQGVTASSNVTVTPTTASLTTATFAPTIAHTIKGASPTALTTATFAPTIAHKIVGASPTALATSNFAPTISVTDHELVTPTTASTTTATFAPTVTASDHKTVTPDVAALAATTFAPTVTASDHQSVTPTTASLATASFAPTVTASDHKVVIPDVTALTTKSFEPAINIGVNVTPAAAVLALATFAPVASFTDNRLVTPDAAVLSLSAFAPGVATPQTFTPSTAALILAAFAPTVRVTGPITSIDSDLDSGPSFDGELDAGPGISGSVGAVRIRARLVVSPPPASGSIDVD